MMGIELLLFDSASASAGFMRFYVLTESQDFVRLAVAIAPVVFFGCLLSVRPAIAGIGLTMNVISWSCSRRPTGGGGLHVCILVSLIAFWI